MKILYLHQYFATPDESGSTRSYEMARRLVERGHHVDLVTTDWRGTRHVDSARVRDGFGIREIDGIVVHAKRIAYQNDMPFRERMRAFMQFAVAARRYGTSLEYDVVFASSTPLTVALPGMYLAKRRRVPFVFEVRDLWPDIPIAVGALKNRFAIAAARWLERRAYSRARAVVVLSPDMQSALQSRGVPEQKLHVIPNGCDLDLFAHALGRAPDITPDVRRNRPYPLVLYAGAIGLINNVSYLARIAGAMRDQQRDQLPTARFTVFGSGALEETLRRDAAALGVLDETFFIYPPVPKNEVPQVFADADVSMSLFADVPGMSANSANKFFDALASGTAVAINYGGWQAELIRTHEAGIVLPPDNADAAAQQLAAFLSDENRVRRAGQNARALAEARFDRNAQAADLARLLEGIVD